ncbi:hypothetical protein KYN89_10140 [Alteriqipengyuania sp. NZ-12B]|uniref:HEPN AbiU2-like domain-containing protein n=1 Tax=Alteriqipengyuania abyssalis TaxID=2860200 RepID=A0ABS7PEA5_9SPHN|nr:hypothetical protein [Alteriqipengyuania abyssalis]MBY8337411.1 hypothetical protein [Alteriqipengyuania abyssalis]
MARLDFNAACLMLEAHPSDPSEAAEARVLSPVGDDLAGLVGHILVSWGQMMDSMLRYTNCLIAYNESDPIRQKWLDFKQLRRRYLEESRKALGGTELALKLALDAGARANHSANLRKQLAHSPLSFATENRETVIVASVKTKSGRLRTVPLRLKRLQGALRDIEIAHGRIHQLALSTTVPVPYSSLEKSLLQEIQAKGWTPHPIVGMPSPPPQSSRE